MWGIDGAAARRRRRWRSFVAFIAFVLSLSALGGAVAAWALELGVDRLLDLPLTQFIR
jgi:hypothetical protein